MRFRRATAATAMAGALVLVGCSASEQAEVTEQSTVYVPASARELPAVEATTSRREVPVKETGMAYLPGEAIGNPGRFRVAALKDGTVAVLDVVEGTVAVTDPRSRDVDALVPEPFQAELEGAPMTLAAGSEHLLVATGFPGKLVEIGPDDDVAAAGYLPGTPWKVEALGDGTYVALLLETGFVGRFNAVGEELANYTMFSFSDEDTEGEHRLWPQQDFVASAGMLYVTTAEAYEVTAFSIEDGAQWVIRNDGERVPIPEHISGQTLGRDRRAGRAAGATIDTEYANVQFPEFYPGLARINTDDDGRLYVFPYVTEPDASRFPVDVYGADGTVLFAGWLPFQGWDAQSDHAVFRVETRDGRRAIVRYELTLPTPGTAAAQ